MFVPKARGPPANIRLGWKGLQGTNTLAYYENPIKSFIGFAPRENLPSYLYPETEVINHTRDQSYNTFYGRVMFAREARSLPYSGAPDRGFTRVGSGLTRKH